MYMQHFLYAFVYSNHSHSNKKRSSTANIRSYIYVFPYIQGGTDTKHQQPMEYAVVDKSKKKNRRGGKQQDVSIHARLYYSIVNILYVLPFQYM